MEDFRDSLAGEGSSWFVKAGVRKAQGLPSGSVVMNLPLVFLLPLSLQDITTFFAWVRGTGGYHDHGWSQQSHGEPLVQKE